MSENSGDVRVTVKHQETEEKITATYSFGNSLAEIVERFGEEIVYSNALVGMKTAFRNKLYSLTHNTEGEPAAKDGEAAIALLDGWKPGVAGERKAKDPTMALAAVLAGMPEEQRAAEIKRLREAIGI
jgi:hypothetical protein